MDSIAVTKPDMRALSRDRLVLSPFGALSQAFSQDLLARTGFEEGRWPFAPLELLEEGEPAASGPPVQPVVQVDLSLVLQAIRWSEGRTEREKAVERIVERIIHRRERAASVPAQTAFQRPFSFSGQETVRQAVHDLKEGSRQETARDLKGSSRQETARGLKGDRSQEGTRALEQAGSSAHSFLLRQNFYSTVNQHIQFTANIRPPDAGRKPGSSQSYQTAPGSLSSRSLECSRQLRLSYEGNVVPVSAINAIGAPPQIGALAEYLRAADASKLPDRQRQEDATGALARWEAGRAAPEELFNLEGGEDGAAGGAAETDVAAGVYRGAQRFIRQLAQGTASQAVCSHAWGQNADARQSSQGLAAFRAVRKPHLPTQLKCENDTSEGRRNSAASFDGLCMKKTIQGADKTVRRLDRQTSPWALIAARRRSELFSARIRPMPTVPAAYQETEAEEKPGSVPALERLEPTRMSHQADALHQTDMPQRTDEPRQTTQSCSGGILTAQESRSMTSTARDIRLTIEKIDQSELQAAFLPPEFPKSDFLSGGELAHRAQREEGDVFGLSGWGSALKKMADRMEAASVGRRQTSIETPSHTGRKETAVPTGGTGLRADGAADDSAWPLRASIQDVRLTGRTLPETTAGAEAARPPEDIDPPESLEQTLPALPVQNMRTAGKEPAGDRLRLESMARLDGLAPISPLSDAELTYRIAFDEAVSATAHAALQHGHQLRRSATVHTELRDGQPSRPGTLDSISAQLQDVRTVPEKAPEAKAQTASDAQLQLSYAAKFSGERAAPPVSGMSPAWQRLLGPAIRDVRTAGKERSDSQTGGMPPQAAVQTTNDPAIMPLMPAESARRGNGAAVPGHTAPAVGVQRHILDTAARDIRLFHKGQGTADKEGPEQELRAAAAGSRALAPETMAYRIQEAEERTAQQPARSRPAGSEAIRAALARQSSPDAYTWLRERLANQVGPAYQITRNAQADQSYSRAGMGQTVREAGGVNAQSAGAAPEWLELAYSVQNQSSNAASAGQPPADGPMDSDYIHSLPDWARRFLQEGAPRTRDEAVRRIGTEQRGGTARNIAALPLPDGDTIEWAAPDYRAPAPTEYREPPQRQEQSPARSAYISDPELQRTADRVYRMIEERIRRERHRLGL